MKNGLPKKFLSRREKNGHNRGRSTDSPHKRRPLSSDTFFSLFKSDADKRPAGEDGDKEKLAAKVEEVRQKLVGYELPTLSDDNIEYALKLKQASGDMDEAVDFLLIQQASFEGTIFPYDPSKLMLGAENLGKVSCYLDALLFAMFAKVSAFECMLKRDNFTEKQKRLAELLRLWVNMVRRGKLVEESMTSHIQNALAACGWEPARAIEQQDTSEAFAFLTETLQLPLLPLKVDLFHQGRNDEADHKVVYERLLNLAIPNTDDKKVRLEDCLEEYFNSQVHVSRDSLEEKKKTDTYDITPTPKSPASPKTPRSTIRLVRDGDADEASSPEDTEYAPPLERRWTTTTSLRPSASPNSPTLQAGSSSPTTIRPHRSQTESIIQRVVLDVNEKEPEAEDATLFQKAKQTASVVKAVTIPAWQFFRLIPWHLPANKEPENNMEVLMHFNKKPIVGICLKRYTMDEHGNPKRQNTFIDIPDQLRLPHFIVDEKHVGESDITDNYKLVLQSVVCHRGDSVHSGHYISYCRIAPKLLTDNRRHELDPPPDYEEAQWVKFDDLAIENRVTSVDDIKQVWKEEMPYLLFYQVIPIVDVDPAGSSISTDEDVPPPGYDDSSMKITAFESSGRSRSRPAISRQASSYFDNASILPSTSTSYRLSSDIESSARQSFADEDGYLSVSRRGSAAVYDLAAPSPGAISEEPSPAVTPGEEKTAQRLSRAAAKFRGSNKSRPHSQAGEGRLSLNLSRFGLGRSSKEPLRDSVIIDPADEDYEIISTNGLPNGTFAGKETKKETNGHKRGKSKSRADKARGKDREGDKGDKADMPDRECIVQ